MIQSLAELLPDPWMHTALGVAVLLLVAWVASLLVRRVVLRALNAVTARTAWRWDNALQARGVFKRLAQVVPALVIWAGIGVIPGLTDKAGTVASNLALALAVLFGMLATSAVLDALDDLYQASPQGRERSIKGYVQLAKIFVWTIGGIVIIACLVDRSALSLLAGLGAVSAVLLLIFKDTILSVVASMQLASNDMLRVGDWIAVPEDNADGDVIEIALHTVKVLNWDKTTSTVPTWHLISRSFRNYRSMYEKGRRIRRALNIDLTSVRFLTPEEIEHLRQFRLLDAYFEGKKKELTQWNGELGAPGKLAVNQRRLSNLGSFRAYIEAYVAADKKVNTDIFWAVRQLDPGPTGIPIQIYAYTVDTGFVAHHHAQDDIFDHLIAILPEFGLKLFQQPSGADVRAALGYRDAEDPVSLPVAVRAQARR